MLSIYNDIHQDLSAWPCPKWHGRVHVSTKSTVDYTSQLTFHILEGFHKYSGQFHFVSLYILFQVLDNRWSEEIKQSLT